jgi:hypothetical protein
VSEVEIYRLFCLEISDDTLTQCDWIQSVDVEQNDSFIGIWIEAVGSLVVIAVLGDMRLKYE